MSAEELGDSAIRAWMERNSNYSTFHEDGNFEYSDSMMICEFEEGVGFQEVEVETGEVEIENEALIVPSTTIDNVEPCSSKSLIANNENEKPFGKLSVHFRQKLNSECNNVTAATGMLTLGPVDEPSVNDVNNKEPQTTAESDGSDDVNVYEDSEFGDDEDDDEIFSNETLNEVNNAMMESIQTLKKLDADAQKYVEDYFDSIEDLPLDAQRNNSRIKQLNIDLEVLVFQLEKQVQSYLENPEDNKGIISGHADETLTTTDGDCALSQMSVVDILYQIQTIQHEKVKLSDENKQAIEDQERLLDQDSKRLIQGSPDVEQKNPRKLRSRIDPTMVHKSPSNIDQKTENHQQKNHDQKSSVELDPVPPEILEQIIKSSAQYYEKIALQKSPINLAQQNLTNSTELNSPSKKITTFSNKPASRSRSQSVSDDQNQKNSNRQSSKNRKSTGKTDSVSDDGNEEFYPARVTRQSTGATTATSKEPSLGVSGSNNSGSNSKKTQSQSFKKLTTKKTPQKSQKNLNEREESDVDSDEPKYCICVDVSFGSMVCCDNELCPIEWFHFPCVDLKQAPRGKWFCPKCRGSSFDKMKSMAEFVKELEAYNLQKELEHENKNNSQSSRLNN